MNELCLDYFVCSMYIVERKIMTTLEELNACGRSDGPDYVLNFDNFINNATISGILNQPSYNNTNILIITFGCNYYNNLINS